MNDNPRSVKENRRDGEKTEMAEAQAGGSLDASGPPFRVFRVFCALPSGLIPSLFPLARWQGSIGLMVGMDPRQKHSGMTVFALGSVLLLLFRTSRLVSSVEMLMTLQ